MRRDPFLHDIYALADAKHTTVGALLGTEKRRYSVKLPRKIAEFCGQETVEIEEERDGISGVEFAFWRAYYELQEERQKKK